MIAVPTGVPLPLATRVASPLVPLSGPQTWPQFPDMLVGSPVMPDSERTLAAPRAAESALCCASSLLRFLPRQIERDDIDR